MFQGWENFFMVCGTAAATLIGLLFVVVTLGTRLASSQAARGVHVFVTPTLVHFSGVLLVTLIVLAPWPSLWAIASVLALSGLAGLSYAIVVLRMMRKVEFTDLSQGDWITYVGAPALSNIVLIAGACGLAFHQAFAPYAIAGAIVLLLFIAIRDAWGLTLWIVKNHDVK
ncbi:MAG: hypothetical protein WBX25_35000 [Rhodomicrobium sp.]